jgi:hypothetical protein
VFGYRILEGFYIVLHIYCSIYKRNPDISASIATLPTGKPRRASLYPLGAGAGAVETPNDGTCDTVNLGFLGLVRKSVGSVRISFSACYRRS